MITILSWIGITLFIIVLWIGAFSIVFGIPGTWIILLDAVFYGWITHFKILTPQILIVLLILSICGEILEFLLSIKGVKRSRPSKGVVVVSFFSGIFLAIMMAPIFFGFGAILGALIGTFGGAFLMEYLAQRRLEHAMHIGWKAFWGRLMGFFSKFAIALAMIVLIFLRLFSH